MLGQTAQRTADAGLVRTYAYAAETALIGRPATEDSFRQAAEAAVQGLDPDSDLHASRQYRLDVARALTRRALAAALAETGKASKT